MTSETAKAGKTVQGPRMPEVTISLPVALGLIVLVLAIGAGVVYAFLQSKNAIVEPTTTPTLTTTATATLTTTASLTPSPLPTFTPLPPLEYIIKAGDYCSSIAAFFNVSIQSIVLLNNLPPDCGVLSIGQKLLIPQPTPTASPLPTSTLSGVEATDAACEKVEYIVKENDTLSGISRAYAVSAEAIKVYNGKTNDVVFQGEKLIIPLCQRLPTPGPTPTPTPPPPYPAPNLLLPTDGAAFMTMNETITLQWASIGTMRENESYQVVVEDITDNTGRKLVEYVTDTKFIVPVSFRPSGDTPHIIRWTVTTVRQTGTAQDGSPIWESAGLVSTPRVFSWSGGAISTPTPKP